MESRLKLEMRHKQLYLNQDPGSPIVVSCNVDGTAEYVPGVVPATSWVDYSDFVEGLHEFKTSWQAQTYDYSSGNTDGSGNEFGSNYSKGVSLDLRFTGAAFDFIYAWLMVTPCQSLNSIEVRLTDLDCVRTFRTFEIKLENTKYSPNEEPCIISMRLREKDDTYHSFQKTVIEDNWQNWFNKDGGSTKDHPNFLYIVEKKPKFFLTILVVLAYMAGILSVGILVATTDGKRWIRKLLGICYFCPSPLIRTYIENICSKYGYTFDTMFDDLPENPYRDVCLFYPVEAFHQEFDDYEADQNTFIYDNRTGWAFNKFLDRLKAAFNAEWYVTPNKQLIFKPRGFFDTRNAIYDFTTGGFKIKNLVYTFNGKKKPAYGDYQYQIDPGDMCSNEIKWRYNAIVDFDGDANNPMLEGNVVKQFEFAMTAFNNDGTAEPYFKSAIVLGRLIAVAAVVVGLGEMLAGTGGLTVFIAVALVAAGYAITNGYINNFMEEPELDGVVRVSNNNINIPRLLLWDRNTPMNKAKVVSVVNPVLNPRYNTTGTTYYQDHPTNDSPGYFGTDVTKVYNYPMYVEERFLGNLYDRFHEYDNPLSNLEINQDWEGSVDLCCDMLTALGVWENDFVKIGGVVILENRNGRLIKGRIEDVDLDYKEGIINLKGRVLK